MRERCPAWLAREISIVSPKMIVVMGRRALEIVNEIRFAVQLSTTPDPVTWRWVLDCRARGITVLTNDEFPDARDVSQSSLIEALEKAWDTEASGTRRP